MQRSRSMRICANAMPPLMDRYGQVIAKQGAGFLRRVPVALASIEKTEVAKMTIRNHLVASPARSAAKIPSWGYWRGYSQRVFSVICLKNKYILEGVGSLLRYHPHASTKVRIPPISRGNCLCARRFRKCDNLACYLESYLAMENSLSHF